MKYQFYNTLSTTGLLFDTFYIDYGTLVDAYCLAAEMKHWRN